MYRYFFLRFQEFQPIVSLFSHFPAFSNNLHTDLNFAFPVPPSTFHIPHDQIMKYSKPYEKNICLSNISYKISIYQWNGSCRPAVNPCVNQGKKVFHFSSFEFLPGLPMSFYCPRVDYPDNLFYIGLAEKASDPLRVRNRKKEQKEGIIQKITMWTDDHGPSQDGIKAHHQCQILNRITSCLMQRLKGLILTLNFSVLAKFWRALQFAGKYAHYSSTQHIFTTT